MNQMHLFSLFLCCTVVAGVAEVTLSSVNYDALQAEHLRSILHHDGIVSIANIPNYAELRQTYLHTAAKCIQQYPYASSHFVSRVMKDGTERFTLSTAATDIEDAVLTSSCPGYLAIVKQFSQLIEQVLERIAKTIQTSTSTEQLVDILRSTENLDHFHAYAPANTTVNSSKDIASTLDFHTDAGILIAMTAPQFFDANTLLPIGNPDKTSGLFLKRANGEIQHPTLPDTELIVMIGQGYSSWMNFDQQFSPVLHGMSMPQVTASNYLRTWFGKMVLPPSTYTLKNMDISFQSFAAQSRRMLIKDDSFFDTIACPRGLRLMESDTTCKAKACSANNSTNTLAVQKCNHWCNHQGDKNDATRCEEQCTCENTTKDGTVCWMLCVPYMPDDQCPSPKIQQCLKESDGTDKQEIGCVESSHAPRSLPALALLLFCLTILV